MRHSILCFAVLFWGALFLLSGCGDQPPAKSKDVKPAFNNTTSKKSTATDSSDKAAEPVAKKTEPTAPRSKPGVVDSVLNYSTGKTHVDIKNRQKQKLDKIQKDYNQRIQDQLK